MDIMREIRHQILEKCLIIQLLNMMIFKKEQSINDKIKKYCCKNWYSTL